MQTLPSSKKNLTTRIAPIDLVRLRRLAIAVGKKPTAIVREVLLDYLTKAESQENGSTPQPGSQSNCKVT